MRKLTLKSNTYSGKLIVFEGTDGAGKTTMIGLTRQLLEEKYGEEQVISVKQPTDMSRKTKLFQKMMYSRNHEEIDYRAVQLLTMSDRVQHCFETVVPALKEGKTVICDRYIFTSLANMLARGYREENWFFDVAKHLIQPNITFLAYVDPELAIRRLKERPRYLDENLLRNVAKEFKGMAIEQKFEIIDTSQDSQSAFAVVKKRLEKEGLI